MDSQSVATLVSTSTVATWTAAMPANRLHPDQGRCVLVAGRQIALFRTHDGDELFALDNIDPFSGAPVIARGLVGSKADEPKVSSPMYKQSFSLRTGVCLDDPTVTLATYPVRERKGMIEVLV